MDEEKVTIPAAHPVEQFRGKKQARGFTAKRGPSRLPRSIAERSVHETASYPAIHAKILHPVSQDTVCVLTPNLDGGFLECRGKRIRYQADEHGANALTDYVGLMEFMIGRDCTGTARSTSLSVLIV